MIHLVPHTHWDREWYEPFQRFRMRLVDLVDHVLNQAEADPTFAFTFDGQMAAIDDYLEIRPEAEGRVRELVRRGQLAIGPWLILSDEFLSSGETLVRNLEFGWRRAEQLGGAMPVGYLPDEFGHVAQMPQLLRRAGIERAVVWRGVPQTIDHHEFLWESPDGSTVRTEYLPGGYSIAAGLFNDPTKVKDAADRVGRFLAGFGADAPLAMYGSDHAWPVDRLDKAVAALNDAQTTYLMRVATLTDYVASNPESGDDLPRWRGELRSSARANLLMGVTSARIAVKRAQTRTERLLERYAEPLHALWSDLEDWPQPFLNLAWRKVIESSGHDSVTGSGVDAVAAQVLSRLAEAEHIATGLIDRAWAAVASQVPAGSVVVLNPSPQPRAEPVVLRDGRTTWAEVPALGWAQLDVAMDPPPGVMPVAASAGSLANGLLSVSAEPDGTLRLVTSSGREITGVGRLVDGGDVGDLYNYAPPPDDVAVDSPESVRIEPLAADALRAAFEVVRTYRWPRSRTDDWQGRSEERVEVIVRMMVELRAGEPFVRLTFGWNNPCADHRLRVHVPLAEAADHSDAEGQFAIVRRRSEGEEGYGETALPTFPARGFVDAGGVALLLTHVSEYELCDGELAVTIVRSVGQISRAEHPYRKVNAGPEMATPEAQCPGPQEFRMAILPHAGDWVEGHVMENAELYHHPLVAGLAYGATAEAGDVTECRGLELDGAGVALTSLRRRGLWLELRVVCLQPTPATATISVQGLIAVRTADLLGRPGADIEAAHGSFTLTLDPWEIRTVQLRRDRPGRA
jgi:alpha-mannosidase